MNSLNCKKSDKTILTEGRAQSLSIKNAKLRFIGYYTNTFGIRPSNEDINYFVEYLRKTFNCLRGNKPESKYFEGLARFCIDGSFSLKGKPLEMDDDSKIKDIKRFVTFLSMNNGKDNNVNVNFALKVKEGKEAYTKELTFDEMFSMYDEIVPKYIEKETFQGNNDVEYNIVKIEDFEQATEYSDYTSWCITKSMDAWNDNTGNGVFTVYFCLGDGFEYLEEEPGEKAPLDEYGLSMISVVVEPSGELYKCTCRWNHDNGGSDDVMNVDEISNLLNCDFMETFKPDDFSEKIQEGIDKYFTKLDREESRQAYDDYEDDDEEYGYREYDYYRDIDDDEDDDEQMFDDSSFTTTPIPNISIIEYNDLYSLIDIVHRKIITDKWYKHIGKFNEGKAPVEISEGKWNYIDKNGDVVYPGIHFLRTSTPDKGNSIVVKADGSLFNMDSENQMSDINSGLEKTLSETRDFYSVFDSFAPSNVFLMDNGLLLASYKPNKNIKLWNVVDCKKIKILFDTWFTKLGELNNDYVQVRSFNNKNSVLSRRGELLYPDFNVYTANVINKNFIKVTTEQNDDVYDLYNKEGRILPEMEINHIIPMDYNGDFLALRVNDGMKHIINSEGVTLNEAPLNDIITKFENGLAMVVVNQHYNFMRKDGSFISEEGYLEATKFNKAGVSEVQTIYGNIEYINTDGEEIDFNNHIIKKTHDNDNINVFDSIDKGNMYSQRNSGLIGDLYRVKIGRKYNILDAENKRLLYKEWFKDFGDFDNGFAVVKYGDNINFMKVNGELLLDYNNPIIDANTFTEYGLAAIKTVQGINFLTSNGELLCPNIFFSDATSFNENGIAIVKLKDDKGYNILKPDGTLLYDNNFKNITKVNRRNVSIVEFMNNSGYNVINSKGVMISPVPFKDITSFDYTGVSRVVLFDGREFKLDTDGSFYDINDTYCDYPIDIDNPQSKEPKIELSETILRNIITEVIKDIIN